MAAVEPGLDNDDVATHGVGGLPLVPAALLPPIPTPGAAAIPRPLLPPAAPPTPPPLAPPVGAPLPADPSDDSSNDPPGSGGTQAISSAAEATRSDSSTGSRMCVILEARDVPATGPVRERTIGRPFAVSHSHNSCKAILAADPGAVSGTYVISASGQSGDAFSTTCDMTTYGGGWTKVTGNLPALQVTRLRGRSGRQMLKCADDGAAHIISPPFTSDWSWAGATFIQVPGLWIVNGLPQDCGNDVEYTAAPCTTWWGVGCGSGPGLTNKLFPGVLDQPTAQYCADSASAHTNGAFSICLQPYTPDNHRSWSVFVRAD